MAKSIVALTLLSALTVTPGCGSREVLADEVTLDARTFRSEAWDDGAAIVSIFRGMTIEQGQGREIEVRDYVVREYLDPVELTKRDAPRPTDIPVIKANRLARFTTGSYEYRRMASLFFERATCALVKGVGTSQEACGIAFQRWDRPSRLLRFDTYWEGEGRGERAESRAAGTVFEDELPFIAHALPVGAKLRMLPTLVSSNLHAWKGSPALGLVVFREGTRTTLRLDDGRRYGWFEHEADGSLLRWTIDEVEKLERVAKRRGYYWLHAGVADESWIEGGER